MKKLLLFLGILLLCNTTAQASCEDFSCPTDTRLSNKFVRGIGTVTGTNFLVEKTAQSILRKQIEKEAQGKFNVKLDSFSLSDLKAGRFKFLQIIGQEVVAEDVYLSYLKLKTMCDYNYITLDKKNNLITFKENFGMSFFMGISEDDLNNTMNSISYKKLVDEVNNFGKTYHIFNITSTNIKLRNNQLMYILEISIPFIKNKQNIVVSSDINVYNGKIYLTKTNIINKHFNLDLGNLSYIMNYVNPLNFSLKILKNKDADLIVENAVIKNNRIDINGKIIVLKDVVTENKE